VCSGACVAHTHLRDSSRLIRTSSSAEWLIIFTATCAPFQTPAGARHTCTRARSWLASSLTTVSQLPRQARPGTLHGRHTQHRVGLSAASRCCAPHHIAPAYTRPKLPAPSSMLSWMPSGAAAMRSWLVVAVPPLAPPLLQACVWGSACRWCQNAGSGPHDCEVPCVQRCRQTAVAPPRHAHRPLVPAGLLPVAAGELS
jgi:hypothetical protein